jgi:hypothetical protein
MTVQAHADTVRRHVAAEVLELGETLFDAVLDAASARSVAEVAEPLPESELRTAAEEFFQTLRMMLDVANPATAESEISRGQEGG